jgi:O-antigen ligase
MREPADLADSTIGHRPGREESVQERLQAGRDALRMVAAQPVLGFGGGTFYSAFPPFKSPLLTGFFDHAHNDYAELAADTGLVGLALLLALAGATLCRAIALLSDRESPATQGVAVGVFMAMCCLGVHSAFDFNLQIPANALTFTAVLALAWSVAPARAGIRSPHVSR